jgi:glycosyltransferase involved in cell wall biosynthesis
MKGSDSLVSVVMPSFNHSQYISEAIESVLNQTHKNFDLIVVDDGSTDDTARILKKYSKHLRYILLDKNKGAAYATNLGIEQSRGELVAILNSDDMWIREKLRYQIEVMQEKNLNIVFSRASVIDTNSIELPRTLPGFDKFEISKPIEKSFLEHFFYHGNFLCHPSVLYSRSVFQSYGPYHNSFRQLPDLKFWIAISKHEKMHVIHEALTKFRVHGNSNTSSPLASGVLNRSKNELTSIYFNFFKGHSNEEIIKMFESSLHRIPSTHSELKEKNMDIALLLSVDNPWLKEAATIAAIMLMYEKSEEDISQQLICEVSSELIRGDIQSIRGAISDLKKTATPNNLLKIMRRFI